MPDQIDLYETIPRDQAAECDRQFHQVVTEYQKRVEGILVWLFERERQLQQRPNESDLVDKSFSEILEEYSQHEKFMSDFYNYGSVVMKCKEDGLEMRDTSLTNEEDRDEIGIQVDTMMVCYEKLKILLADRLNLLRRTLEDRQRTKIERFQGWLNSIEKRISLLNNIGPDGNAIDRQLIEVQSFRSELEQKQTFLDCLSNLIIFDEVDADSLEIRSRSCESLNHHLDDVNTRWEQVCKTVNQRVFRLQRAKSIWNLLEAEGPQLAAWLKKIEITLDELTDVCNSLAGTQNDDTFITKILARSDKVDQEIKAKETFYSSLEHRVRSKIVDIDDNYSVLVIELEKALEEMQENWNSIMYRKRMLDYKLHTYMNPPEQDDRNFIPLPELITSSLNHGNVSSPYEHQILNHSGGSSVIHQSMDHPNSNEKNSSPLLCGSLADPKQLENALSSEKSVLFGNNMGKSILNDIETQDEISTGSLTGSFPINLTSPLEDDFSLSLGQYLDGSNRQSLNIGLSDDLSQNHHSKEGEDRHGCRVEEWKRSLESFSSWLKKVEAALGLDEPILNEDRCIRTWSQMDPHGQLMTLIDIERQLQSTCQDEFDCLILQGQQIISDLIPEIGENLYEANLKEILADIEIRYGALKRCLNDRKNELSNKDRWLDLLKKLKASSRYLIDEMGQVIPKNDIGVDLITLAQQQDQLIRTKTDLSNNITIQSNIQEARLFMKLSDAIQQQLGQGQSSSPLDDLGPQLRVSLLENSRPTSTINDIWMSLMDFKGEIESQLDKLTLHYSELSQLIEDRLERLDEVHREVHALQHSMQELAAQLQVAEILRSKWEILDNLTIDQLSEQLEDLKLYRERMNEIAFTHDTMNSIFDWMTDSGVPLNQQNLKRISELNTIWSLIQTSVDERQKMIEQAFDNQGASEQRFLVQSIADLPNWERRVAASKAPYFVDHRTNKTKWDHPKFSDLLNSMNSVQQVIFSAYRTALKLRFVQRKFGIDLLMLEHLKDILDSFAFTKLSEQNSSNQSNHPSRSADTLIDVEQIIQLLTTIYERIKKEEKPDLDVPLAVDLTLNWLLNLYDS